MKRRKKRSRKFRLLLLALGLLLAMLGFGFGWGGLFDGIFPKAVPATQLVSRSSDTQIVITEDQIYLNNRLIIFAQLKDQLKDLQTKIDQVALKDERAKRVTYNQVETLLHEMGFRTVKR